MNKKSVLLNFLLLLLFPMITVEPEHSAWIRPGLDRARLTRVETICP